MTGILKPRTYKDVPVHKRYASGGGYKLSPAYNKLLKLMDKIIKTDGKITYEHHGDYPNDKITMTIGE